MSLLETVFPTQSRYLPGHRWINIGLRTLHLIGIAGLGAGFLYPAADESWQAYLWLAFGSGVALSLLFAWSNGIWLIQLRGQAILLKLVLLALIPVFPELRTALFILVVVLSGLFSHAPADWRYYSLYHGRRMERFR